MNSPCWIVGSKRICVFADSANEAREIATLAGIDVVSAEMLPYPSTPQLNPDRNTSGCPAFCWTPNACAGKSCCMKDSACDD